MGNIIDFGEFFIFIVVGKKETRHSTYANGKDLPKLISQLMELECVFNGFSRIGGLIQVTNSRKVIKNFHWAVLNNVFYICIYFYVDYLKRGVKKKKIQAFLSF